MKMKRVWPWLLVALGLAILWLGLSATSRISDAYADACRLSARCPAIGRHILFLNLLVVASAAGLPWAAATLLAAMKEDEPDK
jgi:hypothetical protein